jgi:hypothetical protein
LRREIEKLRAEDPNLGVASACRRLSEAKGGTMKAFKKQKPESLETAYHKVAKETRAREDDLLAMWRISKANLN